MRSYDDITERVFQRGDEILRKRRKRTAVIKRTSFAVSGMCAAVLVCFGIWHNNDIKNSINDFHDKDNIITENDSVPQTTTGYPQYTVISESTTPTNVTDTVLFPITTSQTATSEQKAFPENTVIFTTADSIETHTESLHETTRIMHSTAFQVNSTETTNGLTTQTTTTSENTDEEGGIYMKKLTSLFTSAVILASAAPTISHAEFNVSTSRYWQGEKEMFAAMDSGELDTDIDGNGIIDALDGYLLECYAFNKGAAIDLGFNISDEINSRIEAVADYNGDGEVNRDDVTSWVRHFIVSRNLNEEVFNHDYYVSEYVSQDSENLSYSKMLFTSELYSNMEALHAGYYVVSDMYKNGTLDLDVNGNGQLDIEDAYNIQAWNECCDDVFKVYCSTVSKSPSAYVIVSKDNFAYYATLCIMENIELKSEYFTKEYYVKTFGENDYRSETIAHKIEQSAAALGMKPDEDAWLKFETDDLNSFFDSYCKDVENGVRPAPDVNMDGVVDYYDYFDSNIYFADLLNDRTADDSILPVETWNNLSENCDFNGNGTSRDIYDILAIQLYVMKYADDIDDFNKTYNEYVESLGGMYTADSKGFTYENNVRILASLETDSVLYGDANEDGLINMSDAAAIIQHISNKDKHALSAHGLANADTNGDGQITTTDSIIIQELLAGMHKEEDLPLK